MYTVRQKFTDDKLCEAAVGQTGVIREGSLISRLTLDTPMVFITPDCLSLTLSPTLWMLNHGANSKNPDGLGI